MRIDNILVVICEWIAFITWAIHFKKLTITKYQLFAIYIGILAITELANLLFWQNDHSITNQIIMHFNIPLQFIFLYYFLLYGYTKTYTIFFAVFSIVYLLFFFIERFSTIVNPTNFDSLSYGIGNILLFITILLILIQFFKSNNILEYNKTAIYWIILGIILYYIGSFPYQNFRNYFWSKKSMEDTAYFMHYLSQGFNCAMYLTFAQAIKWKIN